MVAARHRRRAGHLAVPADGTRQEARPDLPQLRRGQQVRRLQRLPGRVDVQGLRARRGARAGPPASTAFNSPRADEHPAERASPTATATTPAPSRARVGKLHQAAAGSTCTTGTQHSVNTFFAQLERKTGLCEPYALAKSMGVDLTDPDRERVPSFTLGVADVSPLEMASAYATVAARGEHCDAQPGHPDPEQRRQGLQELPQAVQAGDARSPRPTPSTTSCAGVMDPGGFGQALAHRQAVGRQDRHHPGQQGGLVRRLHPGAGHGRDDRRRQQQRHADHPERPDGRWPLHRRGATARRSPGRCGHSPCAPSRTAALRGLRRRRPSSSGTSQIQVEIPDVTGMSTRRAAQQLAGGRLLRRASGDRAARPASARAPVAETSPACRRVRSAGIDGLRSTRRAG